MRFQWTLLFALIFALLVAIFAVFNVDPVPVGYIFGEADIPLILVIIGSALLGGLAVGLFGIIRQYKLQRQMKALKKELADHAETLAKAQASAPVETPHAAADSDLAPSDANTDSNANVGFSVNAGSDADANSNADANVNSDTGSGSETKGASASGAGQAPEDGKKDAPFDV